MNKLMIIGNLARDPELKQIKDGTPVCTFTVAVNRKKADKDGVDADFFKVTVWRQLAEICAKFLAKGKKVGVVGTVSARAYLDSKNLPHASLEVTADDVEFLSPKGEHPTPVQTAPTTDAANGFVEVTEELPFL